MSAAEQLNNKIIEQTRERLKAWGQWLRALDGVGVGLNSSVTGQYDELLEKGHGPDDPEAERMERIMCRLKKQQPPCYKVLKRIYYLGMTIKDTSEDVRVSEATVKVWRGMGESSVAAYWDAGEGLRK